MVVPSSAAIKNIFIPFMSTLWSIKPFFGWVPKLLALPWYSLMNVDVEDTQSFESHGSRNLIKVLDEYIRIISFKHWQWQKYCWAFLTFQPATWNVSWKPWNARQSFPATFHLREVLTPKLKEGLNGSPKCFSFRWQIRKALTKTEEGLPNWKEVQVVIIKRASKDVKTFMGNLATLKWWHPLTFCQKLFLGDEIPVTNFLFNFFIFIGKKWNFLRETFNLACKVGN